MHEGQRSSARSAVQGEADRALARAGCSWETPGLGRGDRSRDRETGLDRPGNNPGRSRSRALPRRARSDPLLAERSTIEAQNHVDETRVETELPQPQLIDCGEPDQVA